MVLCKCEYCSFQGHGYQLRAHYFQVHTKTVIVEIQQKKTEDATTDKPNVGGVLLTFKVGGIHVGATFVPLELGKEIVKVIVHGEKGVANQ